MNKLKLIRRVKEIYVSMENKRGHAHSKKLVEALMLELEMELKREEEELDAYLDHLYKYDPMFKFEV